MSEPARKVYDTRVMGWIKWTGKALEFTGKLAQMDSFEKWAESQGAEIIKAVGNEAGGYLFGVGKGKKARNFVWNELASLAQNSPELSAAINDFVSYYPQILGKLASQSTKLPHDPTDWDLYVVPRFLVNRDALVEVRKRLEKSEELAKLKGGPIFREYFYEELVGQLDAAYTKEAEEASPDRPLEFDSRWIVSFSGNYEWQGGPGHYYVYSSSLRTAKDAKKEMKKEGKREAAERLTKCQKWLGTLSANDRQQLEAKFP
jgi:hypothetical protein